MRRALLLFACAFVCRAQVTTPIFGYAPNGARIRTMRGVPGAGFLGESLDSGGALAKITISPKQDYVLAIDAITGDVVTFVPGSQAAVVRGATSNPDAIVISPRGSFAALYFAATNRAQIITGLPLTPSIRDLDLSGATASSALAVADDGALAIGPYIHAPDGSMSTIPAQVIALAYFSGQASLAIATPTGISILDSNGLRQIAARDLSSIRSATIGLTRDNSRIVLAESSGAITTVDLASGSAVSMDCGCSPVGLFAISGSVFRLTNPNLMNAKLFDAATYRVLAVPIALSEAMRARAPSPRLGAPRATTPLPAVTINGLPASSGPGQQPSMTIALAAPYSGGGDVTGTATLTFTSSVGGDDQTVQFATGGRAVNFTIPAGTLNANFSGHTSVGVITGTLAGTIKITLSFSSGGTDITPSPAPSATITISTTVPFIQTVQFTNATAAGFTVVVTGFSSTRDMTSGLFHFAPASNSTLTNPDVTVQLGVAFSLWYNNTASNATGSEFTLTVPFFTQGNGNDVVAVTVTLTNSKGSSNPVSDQ